MRFFYSFVLLTISIFSYSQNTNQTLNFINQTLKENNPRDFVGEDYFVVLEEDGSFILVRTHKDDLFNTQKINIDDFSKVSFYSVRNEYYVQLHCKNDRLCVYSKYFGSTADLSRPKSELSIQTTDDRTANKLAAAIIHLFKINSNINPTQPTKIKNKK